MVHGRFSGDEGGDGGRPLVGEHDGIALLEHRGDHGDRRDDRGDRDVAVEETHLGRAAHQRIDPAPDAPDRQTRDGRRRLDGVEAVAVRMDDAERRVRVVADERLDGDDGVDAPTEGDQRATGRGVVGSDRSGPASGPCTSRPRRSSPLR